LFKVLYEFDNYEGNEMNFLNQSNHTKLFIVCLVQIIIFNVVLYHYFVLNNTHCSQSPEINTIFIDKKNTSHFILHEANMKQSLLNKEHKIPFEVCILTSRRPNNVSYLSTTLSTLRDEAKSIGMDMWQDFSVFDVDGYHNEFVNSEFEGIKFIPEIVKQRTKANCFDDGKDVDTNSPFSIPCKVWQLNLDVISTLTMCHKIAKKGTKEWILFMEDDLLICQDGMFEIKSVIQNRDVENKERQVCEILRFSKHFMAYVAHISCIFDLIDSISSFINQKPHDHVLEDFSQKHELYIHSHNLFSHIGKTSTILYRNEVEYLEKYESMRTTNCIQTI